MSFKSIRVSSEVYNKLLDYKESKSFNEVIGAMISYFLKTGTDPRSIQASPFLAFQNSIERIIKIIKAQEKQYFSQIGFIKNYIETEKKDYLITHLEEVKNSVVGDSLTTEELNQFYGEYENLKIKNERLNSLVEQQRKQLENKEPGQSIGVKTGSHNKIFLELFENLEKEGGIDEAGNFVVSRHQLKLYKDRLIELADVR